MKIYILPVPDEAKPENQPFVYPPHNEDYGVEQDFERYLAAHAELTTGDAGSADWHYLPVYWTRWHLNHDYGRTGRERLQELAAGALREPARTFTVCQYDDGPSVGLGGTRVYLSSRQGAAGRDIPLLGKALPVPGGRPRKRYAAQFSGRLSTHPVRAGLAGLHRRRLHGLRIKVVDKTYPSRRYARELLRSLAALAPRGYGGSSFRFFEAMELGVVPVLVGDIDTRPFPRQLDWEACSLWAEDAEQACEQLARTSPEKLLAMGERARQVYGEHLRFGRWPRLLIEDLRAASA